MMKYNTPWDWQIEDFITQERMALTVIDTNEYLKALHCREGFITHKKFYGDFLRDAIIRALRPENFSIREQLLKKALKAYNRFDSEKEEIA